MSLAPTRKGAAFKPLKSDTNPALSGGRKAFEALNGIT